MHSRDQQSDNSNTTPQICAICHRPNQQILLLACSHDPCIQCAALHYFQGASLQTEFQLPERQIYWCQTCFQPTSIDGESIHELNTYMRNRIKERRGKEENCALTRAKSMKNYPSFRSSGSRKSSNDYQDFMPVSMKFHHKPQHRSKDKSAGDYYQIIKSQDFMRNSSKYCPSEAPTQQKLQEIRSAKKLNSILKYASTCGQHPDQYQTYYCFDCLRSICVECALHGTHVGHQVEAVKKSGARLRGIYQEVLIESQRYRTILENLVKQISRGTQEFLAWNNKQEQIIKERFCEMFQILQQKQRNLLEDLHQAQSQGIRKLKSEKQTYQKVLNELKTLRKDFKKNLSVEPAKWDINQLETQKTLIRQLADTRLKNMTSSHKIDLEVRYVQSDLLVQGIQMIEELVRSFKITGHSNSPSQVKLM